MIYHCLACGGVHPSRLRARSEAQWAELSPHLGAVLERCPVLERWNVVDSRLAEWTAADRAGVGRHASVRPR